MNEKQLSQYGYRSLTHALRDYSEGPTDMWSKICDAAADEIEALRSRLAEADALLQLVTASPELMARIDAHLSRKGEKK